MGTHGLVVAAVPRSLHKAYCQILTRHPALTWSTLQAWLMARWYSRLDVLVGFCVLLLQSITLNFPLFPSFFFIILDSRRQQPESPTHVKWKKKPCILAPCLQHVAKVLGLWVHSLFHLLQVQQSVGAASCRDMRHNISFVLCKW